MKEIEITCLCRDIRLPDLGLVLTKGQVEHVEATLAKASRDLTQARQVGAVAVREVQRVRERRLPQGDPPRHVFPKSKKPMPPPPPAVIHPYSRPGESATPRVGGVTPNTVTVQAVVDMGGLRQVVREEVSGALKDAILQGLGPVSVGAAVRGRTVAPILDDRAAFPDDGPTFIPDRIVPEGAKADIKVKAEETEDSGVNAAANALKARKKTTPKKKAER